MPFSSDGTSADGSALATPLGGCDSSFQCPLWQGYSCVARSCVPRGDAECIDQQDGNGLSAEQERDYSAHVPEVLQELKQTALVMLQERRDQVLAVQYRYSTPVDDLIEQLSVFSKQTGQDAQSNEARQLLDAASLQWLALVNQAETRRYFEGSNGFSEIASSIEIAANNYEKCLFDLRGLGQTLYGPSYQLEEKENLRDALELCVSQAAEQAPEGTYSVELIGDNETPSDESGLGYLELEEQDPFTLLLPPEQLYDVAEAWMCQWFPDSEFCQQVTGFDLCVEQNRLLRLGDGIRSVAAFYRMMQKDLESTVAPVLDATVTLPGGGSDKLYKVLLPEVPVDVFWSWMHEVVPQVLAHIAEVERKVQSEYTEAELMELALLPELSVRLRQDYHGGAVGRGQGLPIDHTLAFIRMELARASKGKQYLAGAAIALGLAGLGPASLVPLSIAAAGGAIGVGISVSDYWLAHERFERVTDFYQAGVDEGLTGWDVWRAEEAALKSQAYLLAFQVGTFLLADIVPLLYSVQKWSAAQASLRLARGADQAEAAADAAHTVASARGELTGVAVETGQSPVPVEVVSNGRGVLARGAGGFFAEEMPALQGGLCFAAGTPVQAEHGMIAIETVQPGMKVWSRAEQSAEPRLAKVTRVFETPNQVLWQLVLSNPSGKRESLLATAEHPFFVKDKGWTPLARLQVADELRSAGADNLQVVSVSPTHKKQTVYNFEVEEDHSYFVGVLAAWVHNQCAQPVEPELGAAWANRATQAEAMLDTRLSPEAPGATPGPSVVWHGASRSLELANAGHLPHEFVRLALETIDDAELRALLGPAFREAVQADPALDALHDLPLLSDLGQSSMTSKSGLQLQDYEAFESLLQGAVDRLQQAANAVRAGNENAPAYLFWIHRISAEDTVRYVIRHVRLDQSLVRQMRPGDTFTYAMAPTLNRVHFANLDVQLALDQLAEKVTALGNGVSNTELSQLKYSVRRDTGTFLSPEWLQEWINRAYQAFSEHPMAQRFRLSHQIYMDGERQRLALYVARLDGVDPRLVTIDSTWEKFFAALQKGRNRYLFRTKTLDMPVEEFVKALKAHADSLYPGLAEHIAYGPSGEGRYALRWNKIREAQALAGVGGN
ncbi:MAG: hypothetical protein IPJ88_14335 [Myxococcales bacterium]|nr:MAG: hypothetical protein IPJ88_14335 [Myxococcales bacterium]